MRWSLALACTVMATAAAVTPVRAADATGSEALALAALIGLPSPLLDAGRKAELARLFDGNPNRAWLSGPIVVRSAKIVCRAGNVDITARSCSLTFGNTTLTLVGRRANELAATLEEAGVAPQGAAGSIFTGVSALSCTVRPDVVRERAGGGAMCAFLNM